MRLLLEHRLVFTTSLVEVNMNSFEVFMLQNPE
jgi:hypothetical protein